MAMKKNTDPSALKMRVAVIECKERGVRDWAVYSIHSYPLPTEVDFVIECESLSRKIKDAEFRYRYGTLTFDDDGRKCVIY